MKEETVEVRLAIDKLIRELPMLPRMVGELNSALSSSRTDMRQITAILEQDPGMSAKALRLANSPFFGFSRQIKTVQHALTIIGIKQIHTMVVGYSATNVLSNACRLLDYNAFWKHSMACSLVGRRIASGYRDIDSDEVANACLLHDIGQVILACVNVPGHEDSGEGPLDVEDLLAHEQDAYGIDHCEAGATLAEKWQLPDYLVNCIRHHHDPINPSRIGRREMLTIANYPSHELGFSGLTLIAGFDGETKAVAEAVSADLDFDELRQRIELIVWD